MEMAFGPAPSPALLSAQAASLLPPGLEAGAPVADPREDSDADADEMDLFLLQTEDERQRNDADSTHHHPPVSPSPLAHKQPRPRVKLESLEPSPSRTLHMVAPASPTAAIAHRQKRKMTRSTATHSSPHTPETSPTHHSGDGQNKEAPYRRDEAAELPILKRKRLSSGSTPRSSATVSASGSFKQPNLSPRLLMTDEQVAAVRAGMHSGGAQGSWTVRREGFEEESSKENEGRTEEDFAKEGEDAQSQADDGDYAEDDDRDDEGDDDEEREDKDGVGQEEGEEEEEEADEDRDQSPGEEDGFEAQERSDDEDEFDGIPLGASLGSKSRRWGQDLPHSPASRRLEVRTPPVKKSTSDADQKPSHAGAFHTSSDMEESEEEDTGKPTYLTAAIAGESVSPSWADPASGAHDNLWDDSALVDTWTRAEAEYAISHEPRPEHQQLLQLKARVWDTRARARREPRKSSSPLSVKVKPEPQPDGERHGIELPAEALSHSQKHTRADEPASGRSTPVEAESTAERQQVEEPTESAQTKKPEHSTTDAQQPRPPNADASKSPPNQHPKSRLTLPSPPPLPSRPVGGALGMSHDEIMQNLAYSSFYFGYYRALADVSSQGDSQSSPASATSASAPRTAPINPPKTAPAGPSPAPAPPPWRSMSSAPGQTMMTFPFAVAPNAAYSNVMPYMTMTTPYSHPMWAPFISPTGQQ